MPDDGDRPIGERVAGVEQRVDTLHTELVRVRDRVHKVEKNEKAVSLLTQHVESVTTMVSELAQTVKDVAASIETTAAHAAEHAVEAILAIREQKRRSSWDYRLKFAAVAVAAGGFVWAVLLRFFD